jgi:hypothetical protein
MIISLEGFLSAVEQMREAQKAYSERKSPSNLLWAKKWELWVDDYIKGKNAEPVRQI